MSQQNAEGKIVNPPRRSRLVDPPLRAGQDGLLSEKTVQPSKSSSAAVAAKEEMPVEPEPKSTADRSDEPFNRFYSTFESIFSRLSAPLAFAGLPLNAENDNTTPMASTSQAAASQRASARSKTQTRATASPEYSRLFSPAALRAMREEHGNMNHNPAESFYVVPTTGGTLPYASILARHNISQHQRNKSTGTAVTTGSDDELSDEFLDARETPGGTSPEVPRNRKGSRKETAGIKTASGQTLEELELENSGLKSICDELSKRLWQFEVSSQMSHGALHQSIRAGMRGSPAASEGGRAAGAAGGSEVEAKMKLIEKEKEGLRKENEKLKTVVGRYRDRWESLKKGARQRRESTTTVDTLGAVEGD